MAKGSCFASEKAYPALLKIHSPAAIKPTAGRGVGLNSKASVMISLPVITSLSLL
jgi:hypothetical protein